MNHISTELRMNGITQLFALAAAGTFVVFLSQGEAAWGSLLVVLVVVFGGFGFVRALFIPHQRVVAALGAWIVLTLIFVPILAYAWYAGRPNVSVWFVLFPTLAGVVAFTPRMVAWLVRRAK